MVSHLQKNEKESIVNFLSSQYSNCLCILLSGSLIDGKADKNSDLDLILIVPDRNRLYNETLRLNNHKLQTFVIPIQHLYERLYADYINARGHFIGLLAKSVHLYGNEKLTKSIRNHCIQLKGAGPKPMTSNDHLRARISITGLVNKINNSKENWENLILDASQLINQLIGFKLHSEGVWKGNGKHRMKFIEEHNSKFKQNLLLAINFAYQNKNYKKLVELTRKEIAGKGGLVEFYPKGNIQLNPSEDFISVRIEFLKNYGKRKNTILKLNQALQKLKRNTDPHFVYYFYSTDISGKGVIANDVFCIVHADNKWLNLFFVDWLYNIKKQQNLSDISFPSFMDPKYKFLTRYLYKITLPVFIELDGHHLKNSKEVFQESLQITYALKILKNVKEIFFIDGVLKFENFLLFLFESTFISSYDNGECVTSSALIKEREKAIQQIKKTFELQKEALIKLYNGTNHEIVRKELINLARNLTRLELEIDNFPSYSFYLFKNDNTSLVPKKIILLKEVVIRCMEILFIEASLIPYIFYAVQKIENNSVESIRT